MTRYNEVLAELKQVGGAPSLINQAQSNLSGLQEILARAVDEIERLLKENEALTMQLTQK